MLTLPASLLYPLLALVICAAITDAKSRRIPNWLTGGGVLLACVIQFTQQGLGGVWFATQGMLTGFAFYLVLYLLRALGAGDVKLMAAVGAFAGVSLWIEIFVATAMIGGAAAIALSIARGRLKTTVRNACFITSELLQFRAPYLAQETLSVRNESSITMPHGVAIASGILLLLLVR